MKDVTRRTLGKALACGFVLAAAAGWFPVAAASAELSGEVVRLHVTAASDRPEDQAVKLRVRDAVLEEAARWCGGAQSAEETSAALCLHLGAIRRAAEGALEEYGFSDSISVQVTDLYFTTRSYETFTLPAGKYRTLQVVIGEGAGKNWWCVVFPALCLPAAEKDILSVFTDSEKELVTHPERYRIRFKTVELYEALRRWLEERR